jgi:hypothetical protein
MNHRNGKLEPRNVDLTMFFREQLFEAKNSLFAARSVREMKFLQERIKYFTEKLKELES